MSPREKPSTDDVVERLRDWNDNALHAPLIADVITEITRLREALEEIRRNVSEVGGGHAAIMIATKALKGGG